MHEERVGLLVGWGIEERVSTGGIEKGKNGGRDAGTASENW
jgi:hypothetical protein